MPRFPRTLRPNFNIHTVLSGPATSTNRERSLRLVKNIDICPEIESLLETPSWSLASLLPPNRTRPDEESHGSVLPSRQSSPQTYEAQAHEESREITPQKLHHLLKLSALPPPKSPSEEQEMLADLRDQVHFINSIQKVDTTDVEPLVAIRDETMDHRQEQTITQGTLEQFLDMEENRGRNGTVRRWKDTYQVTSFTTESELWREDPIAWSKVEDPWDNGEGAQGRKMGKFFFVKRKAVEGVGEEGRKVKEGPVD